MRVALPIGYGWNLLPLIRMLSMLLLGLTLFVTFSRMWDSLLGSSFVRNKGEGGKQLLARKKGFKEDEHPEQILLLTRSFRSSVPFFGFGGSKLPSRIAGIQERELAKAASQGLNKVGTYVSERTHREADRVLLNRNQSLSATVAPMAKQVAREVIVTLEPIVAKHNETNQALVGEIQRVASNAGQRSDLERNRMTLSTRAPPQDPSSRLELESVSVPYYLPGVGKSSISGIKSNPSCPVSKQGNGPFWPLLVYFRPPSHASLPRIIEKFPYCPVPTSTSPLHPSLKPGPSNESNSGLCSEYSEVEDQEVIVDANMNFSLCTLPTEKEIRLYRNSLIHDSAILTFGRARGLGMNSLRAYIYIRWRKSSTYTERGGSLTSFINKDIASSWIGSSRTPFYQAESILSSSLALLSKAKASVTDCTPTSLPRSSRLEWNRARKAFFHGHSLLYP
ncbi:hypothetical protein Tco_0881643 [Tanacetum coccineum]